METPFSRGSASGGEFDGTRNFYLRIKAEIKKPINNQVAIPDWGRGDFCCWD